MTTQDKYVKPEPHEDGYWQKANTEIIRESDDDVTTRPAEREAEQRREDAFNAGYNWKGETFEGLSASRKDLWTALCYKLGFPPVSAGYDNIQWFFPSAKALIFSCLLPKKQLKRLRALGIEATAEAFVEWSEDNVLLSDEGNISDLAQRIIIDSKANQAEAVPTGDSSGK